MDNPISIKFRGWIYLGGAIVGAASGSITSTLVILDQPIAAAISGTIFAGIATVVAVMARSNLADASSGPTIEVKEVKELSNPFDRLPSWAQKEETSLTTLPAEGALNG